VPRGGYEVKSEGRAIGWVTSGSYGPTVDKNIGFAMVEAPFADEGREMDIVVRGRPLRAMAVKKPFYKRPRG
ncbi:MAG: glycine cleavage system aminomethyltransferase GcvT, partial [Alicyclobacillaceae bacterium]|nr:glycine cleavage system aminomethyltransferase GcvT [Alicyclobacillaceae bacterium]